MYCSVPTTCTNSALPARLLKLHLLKGDAYTIPSSLTLTGGSKVTVKVHCTAAVVPHLSLRNGRKIPANRLCKHLHVSSPNSRNVQ